MVNSQLWRGLWISAVSCACGVWCWGVAVALPSFVVTYGVYAVAVLEGSPAPALPPHALQGARSAQRWSQNLGSFAPVFRIPSLTVV